MTRRQDFQDVLPKITSLLYSVQQMWKVLEKVTKGVRLEEGDLKSCLEEFLEYDCVLVRDTFNR